MKVKKVLGRPETYIAIIIIVLCLLIQLKSGLFFTGNNLMDMVRAMIIPLIYALCAYLSFVSTGPDVSFPLVAALSSFLAAEITRISGYHGPVLIPYLIAMAFGAILGAVNGFLIVKFRFPSLIVTLGTTSIFNGILFGVFNASRMELPEPMARFSKSILITVKDPSTGLGSNLPTTFLIVVALYAITYIILNYTMSGRSVFALGGDEVSAERAGVNCSKIRFLVFVVIGIIASIAGMSYSVMNRRYLPTEFAGTEMTVIAAVILGGTRMTGGYGTLTGCVLGTMLLTLVTNNLNLVGIPVYYQKALVGIIIVIGTAASALSSERKATFRKKGA